MSRAVNYRPMHPPACTTTVEQMFEKLAQHKPSTPAAPEPSRVVGADSDPLLQWEKPTKGAMAVKTLCGKYACCKVIVQGETFYELWLVGGAYGKQLTSRLKSFQAAQEFAQAHFSGR